MSTDKTDEKDVSERGIPFRSLRKGRRCNQFEAVAYLRPGDAGVPLDGRPIARIVVADEHSRCGGAAAKGAALSALGCVWRGFRHMRRIADTDEADKESGKVFGADFCSGVRRRRRQPDLTDGRGGPPAGAVLEPGRGCAISLTYTVATPCAIRRCACGMVAVCKRASRICSIRPGLARSRRSALHAQTVHA